MQNLAESDASVSHWQRMNISWLFLTYNYFGFLHANAFEPEINLNITKKKLSSYLSQYTASPSQMPIG
jgi:hypothetical protein